MSPRTLEPVSGDGRRFLGLNALRATAIVAVVMFHVAFGRDLWPQGVVLPVLGQIPPVIDVFFVLSGFLVYRPFAVAMAEAKPLTMRNYARNRLLRVLPLYYTITLLAFVLQRVVPGERQVGLGVLLRSLTFTGIYSVGNGLTHVLTVAWTLDDEVVFYILMPLFFLAITAAVGKARNIRVASIIIAVTIAGALGYQMYCYHVLHAPLSNVSENLLISNFFSKFPPFGVGMLLANFAAARPAFGVTARAAAGLLALGVMLLVAGETFSHYYYPLVDTVMGIGFGVVLVAIAFSPSNSLLVTILAWTPLAFLGEISYGIYLWHGPLLKAANAYSLLSHSFLLALLELYGVSVALATITYFLVEQPALRLKKRWAGRGAAPAAPAAP